MGHAGHVQQEDAHRRAVQHGSRRQVRHRRRRHLLLQEQVKVTVRTMRRSYLFPLVASALSLSCAQFMSVPVEPGSDKNSCENRALIEDAEDADDQLPAREGRKGYWYTFKDDKGTEVLPRDGHFVPASGGVG